MRTAACLLVAAVGCSAPIGNQALDVTIALAAGTTSKCVKVIVSADSGTTRSTDAMKTDGKSSLRVAIFRDDLPASVTVQAQGYSDDACTARTVPVEESSRDAATFKSTLTALTVTLGRGTAVDADQDGASPPGDCNDQDPTVKPGATELCGDGIDNDCNGDKDCADPACIDQSCGAGATCRQLTCKESNCADFADGDQDTLTDCVDPDCTGLACGTGTGAMCVDTTCTELACGDRADNDLDTLTDCMESACLDAGCGAMGRCIEDGGCLEPQETLCDDGADNDGDSRVDCADTDCNGLSCADGNACTSGETCSSGQCRNGAAITCSSPPSQCYATAGACALDSGVCGYTPRAADAGCDDSNPCTVRDRCNGTGVCTSVPQTCAAPPANGCFAQGVCEVSLDGGCSYAVQLGSVCSDGNNCTTGDSCGADGGCQPGTAVTCTPPECKVFSSCDTGGACVFADAPPNTACGTGGRCNGSGSCVATPVFPYAPDNVVPAAHLPGVAATTTISCALTFRSGPDAGFGTLCSGMDAPMVSVADGGAAGELSVISVNHLVITSAGSLTLTGTRPVVLLVWGDAGIDGPILANSSTDAGRPGPGAPSPRTCGTRAGVVGTSDSAHGGGGGGAGFGTPGAAGGNGGGSATGGDGGLAADGGDVPLWTGCPGGDGIDSVGNLIAGGWGGGALQLSVAGGLSVNSVISTSGAGGPGAVNTTGTDPGGGGGGSGGVLLLQAARLTIGSGARLTSNGGAGGGGADNSDAFRGADGLTSSATVAPGGTNQGGGGAGGTGGAGTTAPEPGGSGSKGGGGGGGAVGRIFLKRVGASGTCTVDGAAVTSPAPVRVNCP